ncbi:MAG: hypothetical protein GY708_24820 [Actinomycetia bacterium]|nr:hypothetical protein [Actinomycetes bacterium]MCP4959606.1 hypothetical protein [Actinomycetes bacterium]
MAEEFTCGTADEELESARGLLSERLETAGVHSSIARDVVLAFVELTTPRSGDRPDSKVSVGLDIDSDEIRLRLHSSTAMMRNQHESGEQDLMLHLLGDRVDRVVAEDGTVAVTVTKRRLGR